MPARTRASERGVFVRVHVSARVEEQRHHGGMPTRARVLERSVVVHVHVRARLQQPLHDRHVAAHARLQQLLHCSEQELRPYALQACLERRWRGGARCQAEEIT